MLMLNMQIQNRWTEKLTLSLNPKKPGVFLPYTEPFPFEKPGAGVDLTFIARFILIPGAVRCSQPLANLIRWVNWTNYYQFIEECNLKLPSLSPFIAFRVRPMPTAKKLEKRHQQISKNVPACYRPTILPSLECLYRDGVYYTSCPLKRRNLFGMYQYVILNRHFGFWPFAL